MRNVMLLSALCLAGSASTAVAQNPKPEQQPAMQKPAAGMPLAAVAGTWAVQSLVKTAAGKDTAVTSEVVATATEKGWMTKLANRDSIPTRVVAMGGDSVVAEAGPFQSVVRMGQTVTTRETMHFKGDAMTGTIEALYSDGDVVKGTITGKREKKM